MSTQNAQKPIIIINVDEDQNNAMQDHIMTHLTQISYETGVSGPSVLMAVHQVVSNCLRSFDAGAAAGVMSDSAALARGDITIDEANERIKIHFKKLVKAYLVEQVRMEKELELTAHVDSEASGKTKH